MSVKQTKSKLLDNNILMHVFQTSRALEFAKLDAISTPCGFLSQKERTFIKQRSYNECKFATLSSVFFISMCDIVDGNSKS